MVLMLISALGALYSFATAVAATAQADPANQQVEAWRAVGFAFFVRVFVLLALWPRRYPGIWELVILDKGILTLVQAFLALSALDRPGLGRLAGEASAASLLGSRFSSRPSRQLATARDEAQALTVWMSSALVAIRRDRAAVKGRSTSPAQDLRAEVRGTRPLD
jgi:hypothetical protein